MGKLRFKPGQNFFGTLVATSLMACGAQGGPAGALGTQATALSPSAAIPLATNTADSRLPSGGNRISDGCSGDRWVGRYEDAGDIGCPEPTDGVNWSYGYLYSREQASVLGGLADACVYEWTGQPRGIADPPSFQPINRRPVNNEWVEADCHVVDSQSVGQEMANALFNDLASNFQALMGDEGIIPSRPQAQEFVRIAVVDTAVTDYDRGRPSYGLYDHGRGMGLIARRLACKVSGCPALISSELGLPRVSIDVTDHKDGGYFGYQTELAQAIYKAVETWLADNREGRLAHHARLVINLSVGWSDSFGGEISGSPANLPAPVFEVFEAVRYARCHGAMVVAAAGNTEFGPSPESGPLYPAGWASLRAPAEAECQARFPLIDTRRNQLPGENVKPLLGGPLDPMVYPVAGLNAGDELLFNARPDTITRLMAPAHQVASADFDPNDTGRLHAPVSSGIFTGSSVAAAALSGSAAAVWSLDTDMTPSEVYRLIYQSGVRLNSLGRVDVFVQGTNEYRRYPRRIALCRALIQVCSGNPACDAAKLANLQTRCAPPAEGTGEALGYVSDVSAQFEVIVDAEDPSDVIEATLGDATTSAGAGCGTSDLAYLDGTDEPDYQCMPEDEPNLAINPWVGPQPGVGACPTCFLYDVTEGYMHVSLPSDVMMESPSITAYTDSGDVVTVSLGDMDESLKEIYGEKTVKLSNLPISDTLKAAYLTYGIQGDDAASYAGKESFIIYK